MSQKYNGGYLYTICASLRVYLSLFPSRNGCTRRKLLSGILYIQQESENSDDHSIELLKFVFPSLLSAEIISICMFSLENLLFSCHINCQGY